MTSTAIHGGGNITQRMVHNSMLHNHNSKHSRQHGNTPTCNLTRKHSNRRPTVSPHPTHQHLSKHCITQSSPPTLIRPTLSNAQPPLRHTNQRATAQDIHRALRLALRNVSLLYLTLPYLTLRCLMCRCRTRTMNPQLQCLNVVGFTLPHVTLPDSRH